MSTLARELAWFFFVIVLLSWASYAEERARPDMKNRGFGAFEGDLSSDAAFDELISIVDFIVARNDALVSAKGFSSNDVPSVRANIVMLTTLIAEYGGGNEITRQKFEQWSAAIERSFSNDALWDFPEWPDGEKAAWLNACRRDLAALRREIEDDWD